LEGEPVDAGLASLSRFLPEEEIDELSETRDHSDIPDDVDPRDDDEVAGDKVSDEGDSSVSVRTRRKSVQKFRA
jgi:hypothetical protein